MRFVIVLISEQDDNGGDGDADGDDG